MDKHDKEVEFSVSDSFVNYLSANKTATSDNSSLLSIPSCLWLPQGPIIKMPSSPQPPPVSETQKKDQSNLSQHHSEMSDKVFSEQESSKDDNEELSGFSEFVSNGSAIEKERHVIDNFNGILYHVIPTYNQINILFSTKGLYNQFVNSLDKELHSRSPNKDSPIYQTHLQGKKCVITCKKSDSSIVVTGPGNSIWRETTFIRLSLRLFKIFASENEAQQPDKIHSSTPVESRHQPHKMLPLSPIDFGKSLSHCEIQSSQPTMTDINRQLNNLCEITKNLQGQINKINEVMCQLIQKAEDVQKAETIKDHLSVESSMDNHSNPITINEDVNDSKIVPGNMSYSQALNNKQLPPIQTRNNQRKSPCDTDTNLNNKPQQKTGKSTKNSPPKSNKIGTSQKQSTPQTLIIGDSILSGVNQKGLRNKVECQPVSGASVDSLLEKIKIYDLKIFQNIIIYVSGNDASQNIDIEYIEEKYEQLVCLIKDKNPTINIYLCSICPRGDTCVDDINEVIKRQSAIHGGTFIDINKTFYNKNNQLKSHFYKPRDNIHLSSSGTRGLLGCINQHIDIVESFKHCAYYGPSAKIDSAAYPRRNESRLSAPSSNNHHGRGVQHHNNVERCFKCGLTNHKTYQCGHKKQLQCYICKFYGHKDSVCWNF